MSWPVHQQPTGQNYSIQPTAISAAATGSVNMDAYQHMTPEQQFAIQQQNWQQWQIYQQQYAQWQAQYGEQYQREMQSKMLNQTAMMSNLLHGPPPPPPDVSVPPPPPADNLSVSNIHQANFNNEFDRSNRQFAPNESSTPHFPHFQQPPPPPPPPPPQVPSSPSSTSKQESHTKLAGDIQNKTFELDSKTDAGQSNQRSGGAQRNVNYGGTRVPPQLNTSNQTQSGGNTRMSLNSNSNSNRYYDRNSLRDDCSDYFQGMRNNNNRWNNRGRNNSININNNRNGNSFRGGNNNFRRNDNENDDGQMGMSNNRDEYRHHIGESSLQDDDDSNKTPEEIAFDEQFRKWEEQFMNWKRDNANHPDRKAYNDYENKMEECRSKLLQRRAEMRARRTVAAVANKSRYICQPEMMTSQTNSLNDDIENENEIAQSSETQLKMNITGSMGSREHGAKAFVATNNCESDTIPGLDLVGDRSDDSGGMDIIQPEVTSNLSTILGDPNIKYLLSNIQKQQQQQHQQQQQQQQQQARVNYSESDAHLSEFQEQESQSQFQSDQQLINQWPSQRAVRLDSSAKETESTQCPNEGSNIVSRGNRSGNGGAFQSLMDLNIQNPFSLSQSAHNESDNDFNSEGGSGSGQNNLQRKRNRKRLLHRDNQNPWQQNNSKKIINNSNNNSNNDSNNTGLMDDAHFNDEFGDVNNKRSRVSNNEDDLRNFTENFYRPTTIIDYQNRLLSIQNSDLQKSAEEIDMEYFPRKIIDYCHKSKIHVLQTLCPMTLTDYKHRPEDYADEPPPPVDTKIRMFPWQRAESFQQRPCPPARSILSRVPSLLQDYRINTSSSSSTPLQQQQISHSKPTAPPPSPHPPKDNRRSWLRNNRSQYPSSLTSVEPIREKPTSSPCTPRDESVTSISLALPTQQRRKEYLVNIDDILLLPGRTSRPKKIVILMRGPPGSGKSYVAKLIKEKETELGGSARIISIDDYFTTESDIEETLPNGKKVILKQIKYEYDAAMEENYMQYVIKSFKKTITDGLFNLIIVDCNNCRLHHYAEMYNFSRSYTFTPYTCEMSLDLQQCLKNNIHSRTESDIEMSINEWVEAPSHHIQLDYNSLLNTNDAASAAEDEMELDEISEDEQTSNDDTPISTINLQKCDGDAEDVIPSEMD